MRNDEALRKDLTQEEFELFRDWIHQHSGIYLEESKVDSLRISLVTRATRFRYLDYGDYFEYLSQNEDEFKELMNLVTINETSFFRFPAQFEVLRDVVIPEIVDGRPHGTPTQFRVWSAGCSTGEEPYTIAMTLLDSCLPGLGQRIDVVGTDVSTQALEKARKAIYPARAVAGLDPTVVSRHFEREERGYRPTSRVRELCTLSYHNLIKEPYPLALMSGWDVIFCRNVTIYFRIESTRRVIDHFHDALNPGGYLFIGHSETLTSISDRFETVEVGGVFLYRKPHVKRSLTFEQLVKRREERAGGRTSRGAVDTPRRRRGEQSAGSQGGTADARRPAGGEGEREPEPESGPSRLIERAHEMLERARPADALTLAQDALALDPESVDAHLVAAFAYADLGRLDEAMEQAETVLSKYPLTAAARYIIGVIHQQRGDVDQAMAEFKRTVYIDPDFVLAHFSIGNIQRQRGNLGEACRAYENTMRSLYAKPDGSWTAFLGGFRPDLLAKTCERSLLECGRGGTATDSARWRGR